MTKPRGIGRGGKRPGAGNPLDQETSQITVILFKFQVEAIDKLVKDKGVSRSEIVRQLIEKGLTG
jgi:hypothetical protein